MKKIRSLSGMLDLFNDSDASNSAEHIFRVEKKLKNIFNTYNYNEIRTPALEETDLFKRSVGDVSDIVNKEIYTFLDRNGKSISLRPEGTAGVIRSIIEKNLIVLQINSGISDQCGGMRGLKKEGLDNSPRLVLKYWVMKKVTLNMRCFH